MELQIRTHGVELTPGLQELVDRRTRFALARFSTLIRSVECALVDVNGPRGGLDKVCRIAIRPRAGRTVVIEQADAVIRRAVDLALERAARGVAREVQRARGARPRRTRRPTRAPAAREART